MKNIIRKLIIVIISFVLNSCQTVTDTEVFIYVEPYISLKIGDLRQFHDDTNNVYWQTEIVDTTHRIDGLKVYIMEVSLFIKQNVYKTTQYYYLKNGFYIATDLDSVNTNGLGKYKGFNEQRLAKIFPNDGDFFIKNEYASENDKVYIKVDIIDSVKTYFGMIENVAQYEFINKNDANKQYVYYIPVYGNIGTKVMGLNEEVLNIYATYIKSNNKEIGKYTSLIANNIYYNKFPLKYNMRNLTCFQKH